LEHTGEEQRIADVNTVTKNVSKEMARTFGKNTCKLNPKAAGPM
jgi:hypothetical protein